MARWNSSDTGILRKKVSEKHEELLVFGYACKLFRDDDKAKFIDQGKHLIPWMGNDSLRIDRYDGRGTLSDLLPYEASREGFDAMRWLGLSESERKIEQLCDEERYYALTTNVDEEELYKEEELKRLKANEFEYSYDVPQNPDVDKTTPTVEEEDMNYTPIPELNVPKDMIIPKTQKEHVRIEKTAVFVSKEGPQMEILIKAKQCNNPQFSFLNHDDSLYKYYRHILNALKTGTYKVERNDEHEQKKVTNEQETNEEHYLHPSLQQISVQSALSVPVVAYKPTADCSYLQLVNRIQGTHSDVSQMTTKSPPPPPLPSNGPADIAPDLVHLSADQSQLSYEQQQQYYQYYYAMQYYEYYKQMIAQYHNLTESDGQSIPVHVQEQINMQAASFAQVAYNQYIQQQNVPSNPYAQIVSNLSHNKDVYPSAPLPPDVNPASDISKAPVMYGPDEHKPKPSNVENVSSNLETNIMRENKENEMKKEGVALKTKPLLCLVHYSTDSEEDEDEEDHERSGGVAEMVPPDDIRVIIDKMATYVSKNGGDFEKIVKSKGDPRFQFLNEEHEFHAYYKRKIGEFSGHVEEHGEISNVETPKFCEDEFRGTKDEHVEVKMQQSKTKEKKVIAPVSFSIKKPKEEVPKDIKSALPLEESDEEESNEKSSQAGQNASTVNSTTQNAVPTSACTTKRDAQSPTGLEVDIDKKIQDKQKTCEKPTETQESSKNGIDEDDPILEMIDLTGDVEEKRDARRAEDRIKDKLAAAAREKMASTTKDRALQLERKRRAAAFLKLKSVETETKTNDDRETEADRVLVISDTESKLARHNRRPQDTSTSEHKRNHCKHKEEKEDAISESEDGEIKKVKKSNKKKKSHHKRKRSRSRHSSGSKRKKSKQHHRSRSYNTSESST